MILYRDRRAVTLPRQVAKMGAAIGTGYAIYRVDEGIQVAANAHALATEIDVSQAKNLPNPTPERVAQIMDKPSLLKEAATTVVNRGVDVALDLIKKST